MEVETYRGDKPVEDNDDGWWQAVMEQGEQAQYRPAAETDTANPDHGRHSYGNSSNGRGDAATDWAAARKAYENDQTIELAELP